MTQLFDAFDPFQELAKELLTWLPDGNDGSHDISHIARVWHIAKYLNGIEGGNSEVLFAASFLHDCIQVEKNDPLRRYASQRSAERAETALLSLSWSKSAIEQVAHAIVAHSASARIAPQTLEARILRDADRLDSSGAIGIARCFYVAGRIGSSLFDYEDPAATFREPNDLLYALDHFETRLVCSTDCFHTKAAQLLAKERIEFVVGFREILLKEIRLGHSQANSDTESIARWTGDIPKALRQSQS